jgi:E-phenylitaconyl-CoA hydratase
MAEVEYSVEGNIASIVINRPEKMNAMTNAMYEAIGQGFIAAEQDEAVRCVIVTGVGDRAFSAGHDLLELGRGGGRGGWQPYRPRRFDNGLQCSKPLIAAINGYCLAGGLELALCCDIRIAVEHAQFGCPEVKWAILHGYGALRLPSMVGMSNAMYMLLTGEFVEAATALRMGLVSHVVPREQLMTTVRTVADRIAANGPLAIRLTKELAYRGRELPLFDGLRLYQEYSRLASSSSDARDGTKAFGERRVPAFTGA